MKKILVSLLLLIFVGNIVSAQINDTEIETIKKQIAKSNADIQNPKKNVVSATWAKRGEIYVKAFNVNSKYLAVGLEANSIPLLGISESSPQPFYGKCTNTTTEGDFTILNYPKIKIYIKDNLVDHWVDLVVIDSLSLEKSYEAYKKAIELDATGKYVAKNTTKTQLQQLRDLFMNRAIQKYSAGNNTGALVDLEKTIDLNLYVDPNTDSLVGAYYYYAAIFAYNAKNSTKAIEYFNKSIEKKYEIGTSYQYIAQVLYEEKDSVKAEKVLQEGAEKYPNEEKIIYSLIDFYTPKGEFDKAFYYIDKALAMTPNNHILYFVKGNAYEKVCYTYEAQYFKLLMAADSLDKVAFQKRNEPKLVEEINKQKDDILKNKAPQVEKLMLEYENNAITTYDKALSFDPKNIDYLYQKTLFFYNRANTSKNVASKMSKLTDVINKLDSDSKAYLTKAKEIGEFILTIDPNDSYTLTLMQRIYYKLGDTVKSQEMKDRLSKLNN